MKIILSIVLMMTLVVVLVAQEVEEFDAADTEDVIKLEDTKAAKPKEEKQTIELEDMDQDAGDDIIKVNYRKKSAALAMLASAAVPGVGTIYADYTSWTGYVSLLIEGALWYGYAHYQNEGLNKESDYEDYADAHYNDSNYIIAKNDMIAYSETDIYDTNHFRLFDSGEEDAIAIDSLASYRYHDQHYYEDIGKYNKYVFGWDDWYSKYGVNEAEGYPEIPWVFDNDGRWLGNKPTDGTGEEGQCDAPYSAHRTTYISMRQDAEDSYTRADYFTWGVLLNHIVAILDAYRVTRAYNVEYLSQAPKFQFHIQPIVCNERMTPMLMLSRKF